MQDRRQAVHERLHKKAKKPTALGGAKTRNKDLMLGTMKSASTLHKSKSSVKFVQATNQQNASTKNTFSPKSIEKLYRDGEKRQLRLQDRA